MWQQLIGAGVQLGTAALANKGGAASTPHNMSNGGNMFDSSEWVVATGGSKASQSPIPEMNNTTLMLIAGGVLLWFVATRRKKN